MPWSLLLILALVQGATEFLPVSSSGHLQIIWAAAAALGLPAPDAAARLSLDVALHLGTLAAVVVYFRREVAWLLAGLRDWARRRDSAQGRLALHLAVASLPALIAGLALHELAPLALRQMPLIAAASALFAGALWLADRFGPQARRLEALRPRGALAIGLAQCLAFIPGTSRAGVTITAGRALGLTRREAARFALLLGMPTIAGAGTLAARDLILRGEARLSLAALIGAGLAFLAALAAIALMMRWLERASYTPFVIYRLALAAALGLWLALG